MPLLAFVAAIIFVMDQITKIIVVHGMNLIQVGRIEVFPPYVVFQMAWNQGMNFGLFAGEGAVTKWVIIVVSILITGGVLWWMRTPGHSRLSRVSGGLLIGGAMANVIDRLLYGAVADFLNMSLPWFDNPYSFNIADISIFAGAFGLVLFTGDPKPPKKTRRKTT